MAPVTHGCFGATSIEAAGFIHQSSPSGALSTGSERPIRRSRISLVPHNAHFSRRPQRHALRT